MKTKFKNDRESTLRKYKRDFNRRQRLKAELAFMLRNIGNASTKDRGSEFYNLRVSV